MSEQEINRIIAENIVRFLEKKGLSQMDVAAYCGVSQASVSNWCKGIKMPRMDKIDKLCELFGCSRTDLLDEPKAPADDPIQRAFNEDPRAIKLFSMYDKASDEEKDLAIRLFETLLEKHEGE